MISRRQFIQTSSWIIGGMALSPLLYGCKPGYVTFGWVTDVHYAQAVMKWDRYFTESREKLIEAVLLYNEKKLDFAIETGDFKDEDPEPDKQKTLQYLHAIEDVYSYFKGPRYHVLGNHDVDTISKQDFLDAIENTGIAPDKTYYSFVQNKWRFIVLDACFRGDGVPYDSNNFEWYDTAIPQEQINWLEQELTNSPQPVCVFVHQPLDGEGNLYVNNAQQVRQVLESSNKVLAVFQGHRHEGGYNLLNGIHYITQKALVDFSGMTNNSYSIVRLTPDQQIIIQGYRRAASRILESTGVNEQLTTM
ncbi:metallophosphoesterase [Carboxylicivirga mesophila]|uniref:Metallophosphoesterase n=1 Tax=Carboxylicivirga mesophila TaxID=1166478 RepID=A0ABS5KD66_9BACT|nr:metallophosphoesterase [Carboxylicivirga mesophila]MBS2212817.1 metallophosphoesterase [Carboxylicivirga mesophila]